MGKIALGFLALGLLACGRSATASAPQTTAALAPPTGLVASDSGVDALLWPRAGTLDLFVEREGKPFALDATELRATAQLADGTASAIDFACAERSVYEPEDMCSHFAATAPFLRAGAQVEITTTLPLDRNDPKLVWRAVVVD